MKDRAETARDRRPFFRSRDALVLFLVLLTALLLFLAAGKSPSPAGCVAKIYFDGKLIESVRLSQGIERDWLFPERPSIVIHQYADQTIAFVSSDCPDHVCVRTGRIDQPGTFAACVPNRFLIVIEGETDSSEQEDVDLVA